MPRRARSVMAAIEALAGAERLLVASDFDGVLAPIVDDPEAVTPVGRSIDALTRLAGLPSTFVAVVSGRERSWLARRVPNAHLFALAGSHGAELDEPEQAAGPAQELVAMVRLLRSLARRYPGLHIEDKPLSVAAHFRRVAALHKGDATSSVEALAASWPGKVIRGKEIIEFSLAAATKGDAIGVFRSRVGASAVFYAGDDITDEDVFAVLTNGDVGVKVGPGDTRAEHRVPGPEEVADVLRALADARRAHLRAGGRAVVHERQPRLE